MSEVLLKYHRNLAPSSHLASQPPSFVLQISLRKFSESSFAGVAVKYASKKLTDGIALIILERSRSFRKEVRNTIDIDISVILAGFMVTVWGLEKEDRQGIAAA